MTVLDHNTMIVLTGVGLREEFLNNAECGQ